MADCCAEIRNELAALRAEVAKLKPVDEESIINRAVTRADTLIMPKTEYLIASAIGTVILKLSGEINAVRGIAQNALSQAGEALAKATSALGTAGSALGKAAEALSKVLALAATIAGILLAIKALEIAIARYQYLLDELFGLGNEISRILGQLAGIKDIATRAFQKATTAQDTANQARAIASGADGRAGRAQETADKALGAADRANAAASRAMDVAAAAKGMAQDAVAGVNRLAAKLPSIESLAQRGVDIGTAAQGAADRANAAANRAMDAAAAARGMAQDALAGVNRLAAKLPSIESLAQRGVDIGTAAMAVAQAALTRVLIPGPQGIQGIQGLQGIPGVNGKNGVDGKPGVNGKNGVDGKPGVNGKNGVDGKPGINGKDATIPDGLLGDIASAKSKSNNALERALSTAAVLTSIQSRVGGLERVVQGIPGQLTRIGTAIADIPRRLAGDPTYTRAMTGVATSGVCESTKPNGCLGKNFNETNRNINRNGDILNALGNYINTLGLGGLSAQIQYGLAGINLKLDSMLAAILAAIAALQKIVLGAITALQTAILAVLSTVMTALNAMASVLGPQLYKNNVPIGLTTLSAGAFASASKFFKWAVLDRILNILIWWQTLHNAYMLSNNLGQTMIGTVENVLKIFGLKDSEGEDIDVNEYIRNGIDSLAKTVLGVATWEGIKKEWKRYNRIYQAAANIINSVTSIYYSLFSVLEILGNRIGRIGNALRWYGVVAEKAYSWMNDNNIFNNPIIVGLEKANDTADSLEMATGEVLNVKEQSKELKEQKTEFLKAIKNEEEKEDKKEDGDINKIKTPNDVTADE